MRWVWVCKHLHTLLFICGILGILENHDAILGMGVAVFLLIKPSFCPVHQAMVCQCAPKSGEVACGEDCLNRMLNVECLPQQCPCGSLCTNQQVNIQISYWLCVYRWWHPGSFWPCVLKLYWCLFGAKKIVILLNMTCNMMQFQKRCYANVELFRCGKKGHGLRALEDIRRGSFIIEYVGEVCPFLGQVFFKISALCLHCALVLISRSAR